MTQLDPISALNAECDDLDRMVSDLSEQQWNADTPAPGWTVAHQIAHLAATFKMAGLAAADPDAFVAVVSNLSSNFNANVTHALGEYLNDSHELLLSRWQDERAKAVKSLAAVPADQVVPWLVNPLPPAILAMAGMMEAFAHGQDIADALGVQRERTDRIKYLVAFAVRTWDFGYQARDEQPPKVEFHFELRAPSGAIWEFGPTDASQRITGSAVDFCLLTTRRRHREDLDIVAVGVDAEHWVDIAQCYRGPAGDGRTPGQFSG
ncbi:MAG: TIGR03084 family metal-binding protein [Jatrophihabitantaceae bacterium]